MSISFPDYLTLLPERDSVTITPSSSNSRPAASISDIRPACSGKNSLFWYGYRQDPESKSG
jgi:hypothetical protein